MLRLCVALPGPWEETVAAAVRAGAWGVGLRLDQAGEAEVAAMGRRCRQAGLALAYVVAEAEPAAPEPERRAMAAGRLRRALSLAAVAGALAVAMDAGPPPEDAPVPGRDPLDRAADTLRAALLGQGAGTPRLVVRTAAGTAVDSLLRASEAVRRVAHPALGIFFDPVELITLDTYHDNGSFLRRAVAQLGPVLWGCAARDVLLEPDGFGYRLREQPVGQGALDHRGLLQGLARLPGEIPVCVTGAGSEAEVAAAVRHLRAAMADA